MDVPLKVITTAVVRDGKLELAKPVEMPDGTAVDVTLLLSSLNDRQKLLLIQPAIGMWADREDMVDSVEYLRKRRAECRQHRLSQPED